ncbi:MAG: hypothetical protein HONDAALG_03333 [Gammaproteobacteria bacterium]|nr:hypothetical protein [Gammaproteobacteria bacterium]
MKKTQQFFGKAIQLITQHRRLLLTGLVLLAGLALYAAPWREAQSTQAAPAFATITVDLAADVANAVDGKCSLREAITSANTNFTSGPAPGECSAGTAGMDTINIGAGILTISVTGGPLPTVIEPLTIDGGAARVELAGTGTGAGLELNPTATGSVIRSLVINRFNIGIQIYADNCRIENCYVGSDAAGTAPSANHTGITLIGNNNVVGGTGSAQRNIISGNSSIGVQVFGNGNQILGNYIGTDATGMADLGNGFWGVSISGNGNIVGGTSAGARNVISGNDSIGVALSSTPVPDNNRIEGNYIGVNAAGAAAIPNGFAGVSLQSATNTTIGGSVAGAGNVIAGNTNAGVYLAGADTTGSVIKGNFIGTNSTGATTLGNAKGIEIAGARNNVIGDETPGGRNEIAYNNGVGVQINWNPPGTGNKIVGNSIHDNLQKGIRLGNSSFTQPLLNDADDQDAGDNNLQNYPILKPITTPGVITGTLDSLASASGGSDGKAVYPVRVDFYANTRCDMLNPSIPLNGEGEVHIGSIALSGPVVSPNSFSFPYTPVAGKPIITATATDANGNTSEFSNCACVPLSFSPATLPDATIGAGYNQQLTVIGGTAPYQFNFISGLPPGMSITTSGLLLGAPSGSANTYNFTVSATDASGCTGSQDYTLNVVAPPCPTINISPATALPFGVVGEVYNPTLGLSLGASSSPFTSASYSFSVIAGNLASSGLQLSLVSGAWRINGTPTTPGKYDFTVQATATSGAISGCSGTRAYTLIVYSGTPTLLVTTSADESGENPSACSLREAIMTANSNADSGNGCGAGQSGYDVIGFSPGSYTITPATALPPITEPVYINGAGGGSRAEINGNNLPADGLTVQASSCFLKSLIINRFNGAGILLTGQSGAGDRNVVEDCHLGINAAGAAAGNQIGISLVSGADSNRVGGTLAGQLPNVISGNIGAGVSISSSNSNNVSRNLIGRNRDDTAGLPNGAGVVIQNGNVNSLVQNAIAHNAGAGVRISASPSTALSNLLTQNRIFANTGLGVDLAGGSNAACGAPADVTCNDAGDADTGPNKLQNFPVFTSITPTTTGGTVTGSLDGVAPNISFPARVEFYASSSCHASGYGEGESYLGIVTLANAAALTNISFNYTTAQVAGKSFITALAIDGQSNTSEFSACLAIPSSFNTVAGSNVTVTGLPPGSPAITFANVITPGTTTVTPISPATAGPLPPGYTLLPGVNVAFEITTTAVFSGLVTLTFDLPGGIVQAEYNQLRIEHNEGGALVDRTILLPPDNTPSPGFGSNQISARVTSFSPFVVAALTTAPTTTLTATPNPSTFGQTVNFTAQVARNGIPITAGSVTFKEGANTLAGPIALNASGQASFSASNLSVGSHTITAEYSGGAVFLPSQGNATLNVACPPVAGIDITAPASGAVYRVGTPVSFAGSYDGVTGLTHTASWNFASNLASINKTGVVNEAAGTVSASHSFTQAGVYQVTLTVTSNCGASGSAATIAGQPATVVVYDPNGGLITGAGLIASPPGAYPSNPSLTGNASFAFAAKYLRGATTPTGETLFKLGNLNFYSTSNDWLVVAGARAQLKGSGKINNAGAYGFILTIIDGQISGGGGRDKFRIKIWDKTTNSVVYDNQINAPDSAAPTMSLASGGVVILKNGGGNSALAAARAATDFDGDGKTDFISWDEASREWRIVLSGDGSTQTHAWSDGYEPSRDVFAPGDYDGDGRGDPAVFRRADGNWQIMLSSNGELVTRQFGSGADTPVAADYDGDGRTDIAVWRGSEGAWLILRSSDNQVETVSWGSASAPYFDLPVAADYDGDGKADIGVFRRANGRWLIKLSSDGSFVDRLWGLATDAPVPADYDGDGKTDIAVRRGAYANWRILRSSDAKMMAISLDAAAFDDAPITGDFDGDGLADAAAWSPGEGRWRVKLSHDGQTTSATRDNPATVKQP